MTSLLGEKPVFSVIATKSLKSSLFDIFRTRFELKAKSGLHISRKDRKHMFANRFQSFHVCFGLHIVVMIAGIHISQDIFAIDMSQACSVIVTTIWRPDLTKIKLHHKSKSCIPSYVYLHIHIVC